MIHSTISQSKDGVFVNGDVYLYHLEENLQILDIPETFTHEELSAIDRMILDVTIFCRLFFPKAILI